MCTPVSPSYPLAFVSNAALYYPWWKYNLPLICVPKPYKSKSSKVATFLNRYYAAFHGLIQPRKINYERHGLLFFCCHAPERWFDRKKKQEREKVWEKQERGDNIVKPPKMTAEDRTSRHLFFPAWHQGSVVFFLHLWSHSSPLPHDAAHQIALLRFPLQRWHLLIFICRQSQIPARWHYPPGWSRKAAYFKYDPTLPTCLFSNAYRV